MEVLAVDTTAAIDYLRPDRASPAQISATERLLLPLPVAGELLFGAQASRLNERAWNVARAEAFIAKCVLVVPDLDTARIYGDIRARMRLTAGISNNLRTDLWIAAICLQQNVPLLTNDTGFDSVPGLEVLHW